MHSHYNPEFIEARKQDLLAQREQMTTELSDIARFDESSGAYIAIQPDYDAGSPEDGVDSSSESEVLQERSAQVADLDRSLNEVNLALSKIDNGTYGRCEVTDEWIPEDRLAAYPAARTCSDEHTV